MQKHVVEDSFVSIYYDDNATPHRTEETEYVLTIGNIDSIKAPENSYDLNPVEKILAIVSQRVHIQGKQYFSIPVFREAINAELTKMNSTGEAQRLFHSLFSLWVSRLQQVVENGGERLDDRWE